MYTQCPDCETAFKVTAEVLKQAAGKVRCGGCGNAFNALAYLSEDMPAQAIADTPGPAVPELKAEPPRPDETLPRSISAEQSAALLKTLDQLAGSDIRIEDTGVEWRVLGEDEAAEPAADDDIANIHDEPEVAGIEHEADDANDASAVDELLDESPTPVDEFLTKTPEIVDSPEIFDEAANQFGSTSVDEIRFDDNTPLPDDFDLDDESSYVQPPVTTSKDEDTREPVVEEPQPEITLSDPDEWNDILGEFQEVAEEAAAPAVDTADDEPGHADQPEPVADDKPDEPLDMDTQFALQAEAMGIDLSGMHEIEEIELDADEPEDDDEAVDDLDEPVDELDEPVDELDEPVDDLAVADEVSQFDFIEEQAEPVVESHTIEDELAALQVVDTDDEVAADEHDIAPLSEEEQTVNMQIDQDLMALAIEDDDGFASTIIIPEDRVEGTAFEDTADPEREDNDDDQQDVFAGKDPESGFESIVMEGEFVRTALDQEKLKADIAAAAELNEIARAAEAANAVKSGGTSPRIIGGIVALLLLLFVQVVHQSREALATIPAFNQTIGPIYRAIGQPLQPAWDVTGWRFEVSQGNTETDDGTDALTIYSRLGNKSEKPLPYPLIAVSLTDRFEETIGSHVLDPADYLPVTVDPRKHVASGNTFNAVMLINSPAENVTGFKLNVCYRLEGERLSCAIDDFK